MTTEPTLEQLWASSHLPPPTGHTWPELVVLLEWRRGEPIEDARERVRRWAPPDHRVTLQTSSRVRRFDPPRLSSPVSARSPFRRAQSA